MSLVESLYRRRTGILADACGRRGVIQVDRPLNGRFVISHQPRCSRNLSKGCRMSSIDLDRITHPLRLAKGSHQPGSGKGCAMNLVSYMNGDTMITDFPACSARPLARMVQGINDMLAGPDGFLSPEDSVLVIDMGYRTMGTADVARDVVWRWLSDLLVDPEHGVIRLARREQTVEAIQRVSALCLRRAANEPVSPADWRQARKDAQEARNAAYADAYAAAAADADAYAAAARKRARIDFTNWAIDHWRELAGLDQQNENPTNAINNALAQING